MRGTGAELPVVALMARNGVGAKGQHYPAELIGQPAMGGTCGQSKTEAVLYLEASRLECL